MTGSDLALTRALLDEKFDRLRDRERTLLQSIVALDVFVGPLEALRMVALLIDNGDWYAIARRAELYVLGGLRDRSSDKDWLARAAGAV